MVWAKYSFFGYLDPPGTWVLGSERRESADVEQPSQTETPVSRELQIAPGAEGASIYIYIYIYILGPKVGIMYPKGPYTADNAGSKDYTRYGFWNQSP